VEDLCSDLTQSAPPLVNNTNPLNEFVLFLNWDYFAICFKIC